MIQVLAALPCAVEGGTIRDVFLCRTDTGLVRIEERLVWEAIEKPWLIRGCLHVGLTGRAVRIAGNGDIALIEL
jgi:hypothetical protein